MTFTELKEMLKAYIDEISGDEPSERDIDILSALEDYTEPENMISVEEAAKSVDDAVAAKDAEWLKKFKDRFYGRDADPGPEEVTEPETVTNEPEEEELKSILDYEW